LVLPSEGTVRTRVSTACRNANGPMRNHNPTMIRMAGKTMTTRLPVESPGYPTKKGCRPESKAIPRVFHSYSSITSEFRDHFIHISAKIIQF
jgi:hypothetical protein